MQPKVIRIDGVIGTADGEVSSQAFRDQLPANGTDPISVKLHSEGGSVFEGFAIHDICAAYRGPKTLSIESSAFSIASFVAMAFDDVEISSNGYMMLHNPYAVAEGDDEDFAKQSALLGQLKSSMVTAYAQRSGKSEDEIKAILKSETYLNAQQSVDMGFAKRITGKPVIGRTFATASTMPHGVVAALFGAGSGGNKEPRKGKPMSDSTPVAATLQEIEAAFPKASEKFIVKCLRRNLPLASVASAAAEEMMSENEDLKKQVTAMTEELAKYKAAELEVSTEDDSEEEPMPADAKAMDGEEDPMKAKAKARGVRPVAKARTSGPSASARWNQAIESCLPKCNGNKMKAAALADRNNPGLRQAFVDEFNAR